MLSGDVKSLRRLFVSWGLLPATLEARQPSRYWLRGGPAPQMALDNPAQPVSLRPVHSLQKSNRSGLLQVESPDPLPH